MVPQRYTRQAAVQAHLAAAMAAVETAKKNGVRVLFLSIKVL
jgi:hypothetical protein